jgi:predicted membrane protein
MIEFLFVLSLYSLGTYSGYHSVPYISYQYVILFMELLFGMYNFTGFSMNLFFSSNRHFASISYFIKQSGNRSLTHSARSPASEKYPPVEYLQEIQ